MMDMLPDYSWCSRCGNLSGPNLTGILELSLLGSKGFLDVSIVTVLDIAMLYSSNLVGVLLGKNLLVLDRLDRGVEVVLVYLTVYSDLCLLMTSGGDVLILNGGVDGLMNL